MRKETWAMSVWRILIADNEPDFQDTLRARVSQFEHGQDYAVSTASDGPAALQAVMREHPDLVLLDHHLPGMRGLEGLERIHRIAPGIPVIMVTRTLKKGDAVAALKRGAFFYLPKSFAVQYIGALVASALRCPQARP
jgi:CheY-like chemotaxis protein